MDIDYKQKYLKYKNKYLELKKQIPNDNLYGGAPVKSVSPRLPAEKVSSGIVKSRKEKVTEFRRGIKGSNILRTPSSSVDKYFEFNCTVLMSRIYGILNYLHNNFIDEHLRPLLRIVYVHSNIIGRKEINIYRNISPNPNPENSNFLIDLTLICEIGNDGSLYLVILQNPDPTVRNNPDGTFNYNQIIGFDRTYWLNNDYEQITQEPPLPDPRALPGFSPLVVANVARNEYLYPNPNAVYKISFHQSRSRSARGAIHIDAVQNFISGGYNFQLNPVMGVNMVTFSPAHNLGIETNNLYNEYNFYRFLSANNSVPALPGVISVVKNGITINFRDFYLELLNKNTHGFLYSGILNTLMLYSFSPFLMADNIQ